MYYKFTEAAFALSLKMEFLFHCAARSFVKNRITVIILLRLAVDLGFGKHESIEGKSANKYNGINAKIAIINLPNLN